MIEVTKQDLKDMEKQIDKVSAKLNKKVTDFVEEIGGRLEVLERHSALHRDRIYDLHLHLSKKDRLAFEKRFYS